MKEMIKNSSDKLNERMLMEVQLKKMLQLQREQIYDKVSVVHSKNKLLKNNIVKKKIVLNLQNPIMRACEEMLRNAEFDLTDPIVHMMFFNHEYMIEATYQYLLFTIGHKTDGERSGIQSSQKYQQEAVDEISTFLCNAGTRVKMPTPTEPSSPEIWAFTILCDNMLMSYNNFTRKLTHHEDAFVTISQKAFSTTKAIARLISEGHLNSAITLWRHLHEQECILAILQVHGEKAMTAYFENTKWKFEDYDNEELSAELEKYKDLKIVDKHGFRNYGWLLQIPEFYDNIDTEKYRLNIKNGLRKFAKLGHTLDYGVYTFASSIVHPSAYMVNLDPTETYIKALTLLYYSTLNIVDTYNKYVINHSILNEQIEQDYQLFTKKYTDRITKYMDIVFEKHRQKK